MIFNMVGGGAGGVGGGATLVVSSPANVSVTVSKDDKSYTKNSGSLGSATFKGLATGIWTVVISNNGQTATRTIEITADYAITIAFFSASINITYPANSTCVVKNSSGQTVASNSNTTSSTKTWTATVNAKDTYTVTATATDGSGKSKSQSVSIASDGQSVSVRLAYELILFNNGDNTAVTGGWDITGHNVPSKSYITVGNELYIMITGTQGAVYKVWPIYPINTIDLSGYSTMKVDVKSLSNTNNIFSLAILTDVDINYAFASGDPLARAYITHSGENSLDISNVSEKCYPCIVGEISSGGETSANLIATKIWLE